MPLFTWKALDQEGRTISGQEEASNLQALSQALEQRSLVLFQARARNPRGRHRPSRRVKRSELVHFSDQMVILVRSGVPLLTGLQEIASETAAPGFRAVLQDVIRRISEGSNLSGALAAHPRIFSEAYVSAVTAGEEMGRLDDVLERLAQQMEWAEDTRKQVLASLVQPIFLLLAVTGLTALVVGVLVPKITQIYLRSGKSLPGVTQALVQLSEFLRTQWGWILAVVALVAACWALAGRFPGGRLFRDGLKLRLPVMGRVIWLFSLSRFVHLFSVLYQSGVTVDRNLEIVGTTTGNTVVNGAVARMREIILGGSTMSEAASETGVFPGLVVRMLHIGEQSGHVPEALDKVCSFYDKEIPRALKRIVTVLQPTLLIISAGAVCFVVFAAFMPIVRLVTGGH